jgi:hypothetical protein
LGARVKPYVSSLKICNAVGEQEILALMLDQNRNRLTFVVYCADRCKRIAERFE